MKKISVVIPTYNEEKVIERCLKAISDQTIHRDDYEIIVVDAPSKDRTQEIAKKYADKIIIQKSKGVGGARNDGVAVSQTDMMATTDADIVVPKDWLERMLSIKNSEHIAVCGSLDSLEEDFKSKFCVEILDGWARMCNSLGKPLLSGTNSGVKTDVFLKVNGYRDLPMNDDVELGLRLLDLGKIKFDKNMVVKFSTRRFMKKGIWKTLITYLKEDINLITNGDVKTKDYAKQDYS